MPVADGIDWRCVHDAWNGDPRARTDHHKYIAPKRRPIRDNDASAIDYTAEVMRRLNEMGVRQQEMKDPRDEPFALAPWSPAPW